jgi:NAD(P)-dependent dehydrogenase (short-subunit alcohol dehydrogenase family)
MIGQTSSGPASGRLDHPLDLSRQLVIVSGGAGAIGVAIVNALCRHNAGVIVFDMIEPTVAETRLPVGTGYVQVDLADPAAVEDAYERAIEMAGRLPTTVLAHAGVVESGPVHAQPLAEFERVLTTNTRSAYLLARTATQRWIGAGEAGHLIFTTSWVQDVPWPDISAYIASKAAIRALMRSFARELAPHGIRANAIAPGIVGVGMAQHQWDTEPPYRARAGRAVPLGHLQTPESVADGLLFLTSDMASYMTGSVLLMDGGASLYPMDPE